MFKIAGAVLAFASVAAMGYRRSRLLYVRCKTLEDFHRCIFALRCEISLRQTPLEKAFRIIGDRYNNSCFIRCSELIESLGAETAFERAVTELSENSGICEEDYNVISELSSGLGRCDMENQLKRLDYALLRLENAMDEAKGNVKDKAGFFVRTALMAASAIVIALY